MRRLLSFLLLFPALAFFPLHAQWPSDPMENKLLVASDHYSSSMAPLEDGSFYLYMDMAVEDIHRIHSFIYYFDKDGNPVWDEPVVLGGDSTRSFVKTMTRMMLDKDNNVIIARQAFKDQIHETYRVYKINPEGELLWPGEGIDLYGNATAETITTAALKMTQLEDGNYVFAWMDNGIMAQKLSPEGERLWGNGKNLGSGAYPYVVNAGDGDFIMVYQNSGLMARRLDFEGNDVWTGPVTAFDGDLNPSTPTWTYLDVLPVEKGALISFYAFEGGLHYPCLSYVKSDGTLGFAAGTEGLRLGYSVHLGFNPSVLYDPENKAIYACWPEYLGTQTNTRCAAQKISLEGELLWNPEGVQLLPLKYRVVRNPTVSLGPKGTVLFGIMESTGVGASSDPMALRAFLLNPDGSFVWEDSMRTVSGVRSYKSDVFCSGLANNQWTFVWEDCRDNGGMVISYFYGQTISPDGILGSPSANETSRQAPQLSVFPNPVKNRANITWHQAGTQSTNMQIKLLDLKGRELAEIGQGKATPGKNHIEWDRPSSIPSGMYILQMRSPLGISHAKIILQ